MNDNIHVWDETEAINFISEICDIDKDIIEKVLKLEAEYMESIGIIE